MKKAVSVILAMIFFLSHLVHAKANDDVSGRTYGLAVEFSVLIHSLNIIEKQINIIESFDFDLPLADNDYFYYNPPITIFKQNGKVSAILSNVGKTDKDFYEPAYNAVVLINYCLIHEGTTEWIADKASALGPLFEEGLDSNKNTPLALTENYSFYYDTTTGCYTYRYTGL